MARSLRSEEVESAIAEYDRDGATVLRNVIAPEWIDRLGEAVDVLMAKGVRGTNLAGAEEGRFFGDLFSWLNEPTIEAFVREAGLAEVAGRIMRSSEVRFFYDQLLVKEPGTPKRTPWHQDLPYWPVAGDQILSIWVAIDPATPSNGVVTYVRGSHKWKRFFPMEPFSEDARADLEAETRGLDIYDADVKGQWGNLGDIRDNPDRYDLVAWNVEPGDVIVHHPLTVHGAPGNLSIGARRRALATRWFGLDARWDDSRPHFMRRLQSDTAFPYPRLGHGEAVTDPLFPLLWKASESVAATG